jgi:hypothetical protein
MGVLTGETNMALVALIRQPIKNHTQNIRDLFENQDIDWVLDVPLSNSFYLI